MLDHKIEDKRLDEFVDAIDNLIKIRANHYGTQQIMDAKTLIKKKLKRALKK